MRQRSIIKPNHFKLTVGDVNLLFCFCYIRSVNRITHPRLEPKSKLRGNLLLSPYRLASSVSGWHTKTNFLFTFCRLFGAVGPIQRPLEWAQE